jgi:5'-3' exoribonuclease 2
MPLATQALAGSNSDVVANRRAIRMANMSAAEMLKAELSGHPVPPKPDLSLPPKPSILPDPDSAFIPKSSLLEASQMSRDSRIAANAITGTGSRSTLSDDQMDDTSTAADKENDMVSDEGVPPASAADSAENARGVKRKFDETEEDAVDSSSVDEEAVPAATAPALKVNPDGTVEQEDTVKCVVLASSRD